MPATQNTESATFHRITVGSRILIRENFTTAIGEHIKAGTILTVFSADSVNVRATSGTCAPWIPVGGIEGARTPVCGIKPYTAGAPLLLA